MSAIRAASLPFRAAKRCSRPSRALVARSGDSVRARRWPARSPARPPATSRPARRAPSRQPQGPRRQSGGAPWCAPWPGMPVARGLAGAGGARAARRAPPVHAAARAVSGAAHPAAAAACIRPRGGREPTAPALAWIARNVIPARWYAGRSAVRRRRRRRARSPCAPAGRRRPPYHGRGRIVSESNPRRSTRRPGSAARAPRRARRGGGVNLTWQSSCSPGCATPVPITWCGPGRARRRWCWRRRGSACPATSSSRAGRAFFALGRARVTGARRCWWHVGHRRGHYLPAVVEAPWRLSRWS